MVLQLLLRRARLRTSLVKTPIGFRARGTMGLYGMTTQLRVFGEARLATVFLALMGQEHKNNEIGNAGYTGMYVPGMASLLGASPHAA